MHIYDPADRIRYVHLDAEPDPSPLPGDAGSPCDRLPAGYANRSPRTYLGRLRPGTASAPAAEEALRRA